MPKFFSAFHLSAYSHINPPAVLLLPAQQFDIAERQIPTPEHAALMDGQLFISSPLLLFCKICFSSFLAFLSHYSGCCSWLFFCASLILFFASWLLFIPRCASPILSFCSLVCFIPLWLSDNFFLYSGFSHLLRVASPMCFLARSDTFPVAFPLFFILLSYSGLALL